MWFYVGLEQTWFEVWGLVSFGWFEIWFGVWGTKLSVTQGDQIIFLCLYSFAIGVIGLRSLRKRNLAFIFRYYGLFTYHTSHAVATSCSFLQLAVLYWLQLWYLCWFLFLQILSKKLLQKYENTTWHLYHWVHTDCLKFTTNTKNHVIIIERNFFKWYGKVRQDITSATTFTIEFREYSLYSLPIHILFFSFSKTTSSCTLYESNLQFKLFCFNLSARFLQQSSCGKFIKTSFIFGWTWKSIHQTRLTEFLNIVSKKNSTGIWKDVAVFGLWTRVNEK